MSIFKINNIKNLILKIKYRNIQFGENILVLGKFPYFKSFYGSKCKIGNNVVLNSDSKHSNTALSTRCKFVVGYTGSIEIGENTMLNGCSITSYKSVIIGKNCQIASFTLITDTDFHPVNPYEREKQITRQKYALETVSKKNVIIGDNVWIGWNALILKGTIVGNNSVVAAGSVVLGEFPANVVIAGNPARIVKKI